MITGSRVSDGKWEISDPLNVMTLIYSVLATRQERVSTECHLVAALSKELRVSAMNRQRRGVDPRPTEFTPPKGYYSL